MRGIDMRDNNQKHRQGSTRVILAVSLLALLVVSSLYALDKAIKKPKVLKPRESSASKFRQPPRNDEHWLEKLVKASELGCGQASYKLGSIYELGRYGVPKDLSTSLAYYQKAERRKVSGAKHAIKRLNQWIFIAKQKAAACPRGPHMRAKN